MTRIFVTLTIVLVAMLPVMAIAQMPQPLYTGMPPGSPGIGFPGTGQPSPFSGLSPGPGPYQQAYPDQRWVFAPYVKPGYQWMEYHANFPQAGVFIPYSNRIFNNMDLRLKDPNFWVGFAGLEVQPVQSLVFYGEVGSNVPTNVRFDMNAQGRGTASATPDVLPVTAAPPVFFPGENLDANLTSPWEWTGKNFFWWMVETGAAWWVSSQYAVEAGFRAEHVDFKLTDPRNNTYRIDIDQNDPIPPYPGREIVCTRI
jgi:hypothetical protein